MGKEKVKNSEIAQVFKKIADILEINNENPFRIRAYRRAAQNVENLTEDLSVLVAQERLNVPGVGQDLAGKIKEMVNTGSLEYFEKIKKTIPAGLFEMMDIPGLGPKTVRSLYDKLKIDSIRKLERAARNHKIRGLFGFKEKTEENILRGIELIKQGRARMFLFTAMNIAEKIVGSLKKLKVVKNIAVAGSLRRREETVGDIDILVTSTHPEKVIAVFTSLADVEETLAKGPTKASIYTKGRVQVDLRVVSPDSFGAALCYFTGSKAHNIRIRDLAKKSGLKINEYGVFNERTDKKIAGKTEKDIYKALKLPFIAPEIRQDTGEIEAAKIHNLPRLVRPEDIKADLHVHSNWSDGAHPIEGIAKAAQAQGHRYMVISDHSQSLGIARGLTPLRLKKQIAEIKTLNKKFKNFRILCGAEVDIKSDGRLDFDNEMLKKLDVVLAAIHSGFKQSKEQLTQRLIKAMQNKYVNIIVHPFGRLISERAAYELDFEEILKVAKKTNTALEINCYFKRLDLDFKYVRRAKETGVLLAIGTDSHILEQLKMIELGVSVARRGWLQKKDLLNSLSCGEFLKRIRK